MAVAKTQIGCDMARLQRDLQSQEIETTLDEVRRLAGQLGITRTPSYVVGGQALGGAVGVDVLADRIKAARK